MPCARHLEVFVESGGELEGFRLSQGALNLEPFDSKLVKYLALVRTRRSAIRVKNVFWGTSLGLFKLRTTTLPTLPKPSLYVCEKIICFA